MTDSRSKQPSGDPQPSQPGELVRGCISIALVAHLFCVFMVMSANLAPSLIQRRLLVVLRPYTQLLNFDLNFTPYYLTHADVGDVDHRIEVLPRNLDETDGSNWIVLPDVGHRAGDRYQRYQRLAVVMAFLADQEEDDLAGMIAKDVATNFLRQRGVKPRRVRCRRHMLQSMEALGGGNSAERDTYDPMYFRQPYAANVLIDDGVVDVVKIDMAGRVARPDENDD